MWTEMFGFFMPGKQSTASDEGMAFNAEWKEMRIARQIQLKPSNRCVFSVSSCGAPQFVHLTPCDCGQTYATTT